MNGFSSKETINRKLKTSNDYYSGSQNCRKHLFFFLKNLGYIGQEQVDVCLKLVEN